MRLQNMQIQACFGADENRGAHLKRQFCSLAVSNPQRCRSSCEGTTANGRRQPWAWSREAAVESDRYRFVHLPQEGHTNVGKVEVGPRVRFHTASVGDVLKSISCQPRLLPTRRESQ